MLCCYLFLLGCSVDRVSRYLYLHAFFCFVCTGTDFCNVIYSTHQLNVYWFAQDDERYVWIFVTCNIQLFNYWHCFILAGTGGGMCLYARFLSPFIVFNDFWKTLMKILKNRYFDTRGSGLLWWRYVLLHFWYILLFVACMFACS